MKRTKHLFGVDLSYNLQIQKTSANFWYTDNRGITQMRLYYNITQSSALRLSQLIKKTNSKYLAANGYAVGWSYANYDLARKLRGDKES